MANMSCVESGTGATGEVFEAIACYLESENGDEVETVHLENVLRLATQPINKTTKKPVGPSNADVVIDTLDRRLDQVTTLVHLSGDMAGSKHIRNRVWLNSNKRRLLQRMGISEDSAHEVFKAKLAKLLFWNSPTLEDMLLPESSSLILAYYDELEGLGRGDNGHRSSPSGGHQDDEGPSHKKQKMNKWVSQVIDLFDAAGLQWYILCRYWVP